MAKQTTNTITIDSVFGGLAPSQNFSGNEQYLSGIGIDPYLPISDAVGDRVTSGALRPSGYASFSGANVNANPYWFITTPKNTLVYSVLNNGRLISYTSALGNETLVGTATTSSGNGAAYYKNYIYVATNTNVSRYGPLNGTPALTDSVWTGATLGSQTALVNTTYPSIRGSGTLPNHPMHVHIDGNLYVGDFDSTSSTAATRGKGLIHKISTTYVTYEGDTNNASAYNVLDLPAGYMPVDIESAGNDLVILAIQTSDGTISQGNAALFVWNTIADSFYLQVEVPDAMATALLNVNGIIYVFSGPVSTGTDVSNGYRVSAYAPGTTQLKTVYYSDIGTPPLAGAVDKIGDRIYWGGFSQINTTTASSPTYYATVQSLGSKNPAFPGGVHNVINATATGSAADGIVTSIKAIQQNSLSYPKLIIGHRDADGPGLDKQSTTYATNVWRSKFYQIGRKFILKRIRFSLGAAVAANMTITPKIFLDDFSFSSTSGLTVINSTNYANNDRHVSYYPDISGNHNFCLELTWSGTALIPVLLPIIIEFEVIED